MKVQEVASGVHRIADGIVNCYLVEEDGEVALYDAGWPSSRAAIGEALSGLGLPPAPTAVVLTHAHPDHLGAAERLRHDSGAQVHVHRPELARARGEAKGASPFALVPGLVPTLWRPSALAFVAEATLRGFMNPTWLEGATTFEAGDTLDLPGRPRVVPTPGHTEGHVSFLLDGKGVLIAGDALASLDVLTRARGPRLMPSPLNGDDGRSADSLAVLEPLAADTVLFGHGAPFRGSPAEAVARARETHQTDALGR